MKTAVEWLEFRYKNNINLMDYDFEQAKEIEKQQEVYIEEDLETLEEAAEKWFNKDGFYPDPKQGFISGAKWQQEQIGNLEFLKKLRATLSDAEARRLILEQFKNK